MSSGRPAGWRALAHAGRWLLAVGALALALAPGCAKRSEPGPVLHRVVIRGFVFEPAGLSIASGDTVEWLNQDVVPHTASAVSGRWDSGAIAPASSWRTAVTAPGPEPYVCRMHPGMKARLDVR